MLLMDATHGSSPALNKIIFQKMLNFLPLQDANLEAAQRSLLTL